LDAQQIDFVRTERAGGAKIRSARNALGQITFARCYLRVM
jgi:hypothetical protein